jgi:hypothetical protein
MTSPRIATFSLLAISLFALPVSLCAAAEEPVDSDKGYYAVSYTSDVDPIEINRIHAWTLHVETVNGNPVEDAEISVDGGMPAHNHGLPTKPRVTENLGDGNYRVEGLRFHMGGAWQLTFTIDSGGNVDTVTFDLAL